MSRAMRLVLTGAALLLVICGVWFGLTPKASHIAECGSPFFPVEKADLSREAAFECGFALNKRYTLLWWLFIAAGVLGLLAALGHMFTKATPSEDPADAKRA